MDQRYNDKMKELGYDQLVCEIFDNWENVKDEILIPERKIGSGNGTIHVFLGAADYELRKEFPAYYSAVEKGEDPAVSAVKVTHYFLTSNIVSMLGYVCQYCYTENQNIGEHVNDILNTLSQIKAQKGFLTATSLFKLSLGSNKLRPYFKQFNNDGAFTKIIRKILLPDSSYKISLYKNDNNEYAAFWLFGFDWLSDFEADSNGDYLELPNKDFKTLEYQSFNLYRPYITAIKSKPFLLLAGISGTGKSRIVRELARACWEEGTPEYEAPRPRNFEMIQVKPNWHDSSELIGYVSRVSGEPVFVVGEFLKFIARAWENEDVPHFLCLDEMNLAPVEQYFAEYLSVIESRKNGDDGKVVTDAIVKKEAQTWYWNLCDELTTNETLRVQFRDNGITLPKNLIVVGTVNMDETTFSFSRKVLDRAMTIEMNEVDLASGLDHRHERIGLLGERELIGSVVEGVDVYKGNREVCDVVINYLKAINERLENTPFKIAYRTRNEALLYVVNNLPYNKDEYDGELPQSYVIARALDEITNMKILSRIEGDETKIGTLLNDLKSTIKEQLTTISEETFPMEQSVSLAKLNEMEGRLKQGYTSFWS